ncbi:MAG: lantibiotic dehydratase, partial [Bacteroidota bacterium]
MKVFPYILSRVAGVRASKIYQLTYGKMETVEELLEKEKKLILQGEKLLAHFQDTFRALADYRQKAILANAKKDFVRGSFSFIKKLKQQRTEKGWIQKIDELIEVAETYQAEILQTDALKEKMEREFEEDRIAKMLWLQNFAHSDAFKRGILQSSHSLYHQIVRFQKKIAPNFRKKEWQTARSIAQYFYRAATKTSPFSYFSTLALLHRYQDTFKSDTAPSTSSISINNILLLEFQDVLLTNASFYQQMKLVLNPTLSKDDVEFIFIKNENNIENLQRLEKSAILEIIEQYFLENQEVVFNVFLVHLAKIVAADPAELVAFLLQIIDTGFLEWQWEVKALTKNWEEKFSNWLADFADFEGKSEWLALLHHLKRSKQHYHKSNAVQRTVQVKTTVKQLQAATIGINKVVPELIFFEDVKTNHNYTLSATKTESICRSLHRVLQMIQPISVDHFRLKIRRCFEANYNKNEEVKLLAFYEKFYATASAATPSPDEVTKKLSIAFEKMIQQTATNEVAGVVEFSTKKWEKHLDFTPHLLPKQIAYGGLFQFFGTENNVKAVLNGLTLGYGKLFGRFLGLLDESITKEIQYQNRTPSNEQYWIENKDASYFNANLHPPLFDLEIRAANTQNQLPPPQQIPVRQLLVKWDEQLNEPVLVHALDKKRCVIFDMGLEHPHNRSALFRLLNGFSFPKAALRTMNNTVNKYFSIHLKNGIKICPRIVIDEHLILQRKSFEIPESLIPYRGKKETSASYFYTIQKWKATHDFPRFVFFQPIAKQNST